jgi:GDP-L-fucose synthase
MDPDIDGFEGTIENDLSKPDGTPRKLLDVSRINGLGWRAQITLHEGLKRTYAEYLAGTTAAADA